MFGTRRDFIKTVSAGAAGLTMGMSGITGVSAAKGKVDAKSTVSFSYGDNRRKLIREVLEPLEEKIRKDVRGKQVIIKPNCVWDMNDLCATDVDALRGVLDFLKPFYKETVVVAESTASPNGTMKCFEDYKYTRLHRDYNTGLMDLNRDSYSNVWILDSNRHPLDIKIIDTFLNPDNYIISLARMKTHGSVVATLALKNMVLASPLNVREGHRLYVSNQYEKAKMHQGGFKGINYNMYLIAQKVRPSLALIDGYVGMQGNGPRRGWPMEHGVAVAGTDVVAVDRMGIELMGIKYEDVGYLQWCANSGLGQGDLSKIDIVGPDYKPHIKEYKAADNFDSQMQWKEGKS